MEHADLARRYWDNHLVQVQPEQGVFSKVPPESLDFLLNVGLPVSAELFRRMRLYWNLKPKMFIDSRFENTALLDIGNFYYKNETHPVVIDCSNATVLEILPKFPMLPPSPTGDKIFINENISEFVIYLGIYLKYKKRLDDPVYRKTRNYTDLKREEVLRNRALAQKEILKTIDKIRTEFSSVNPKPVSSVELFWGSLLFELEDL